MFVHIQGDKVVFMRYLAPQNIKSSLYLHKCAISSRLPQKLASEYLDWHPVERLLLMAYGEKALLPKSACLPIW